LQVRFKHADLVVYFNFPRLLCLVRIVQRLFLKDTKINDRPKNYPEVFNWKLIHYMWGFDNRIKDKLTTLKKKYPHATFIEVRSDADLCVIEKLTR